MLYAVKLPMQRQLTFRANLENRHARKPNALRSQATRLDRATDPTASLSATSKISVARVECFKHSRSPALLVSFSAKLKDRHGRKSNALNIRYYSAWRGGGGDRSQGLRQGGGNPVIRPDEIESAGN